MGDVINLKDRTPEIMARLRRKQERKWLRTLPLAELKVVAFDRLCPEDQRAVEYATEVLAREVDALKIEVMWAGPSEWDEIR